MVIQPKLSLEICAPAKIALSIAHALYSKGAEYKNINEYDYSLSLSLLLRDLLEKNAFEVKLFDKSLEMKSKSDYSQACLENISNINKWRPDLTLEIHLNAVDISTKTNKELLSLSENFANYGEYLYFGKSKAFAQKLEDSFRQIFKIRQSTRALRKKENGYFFVNGVIGCCVLAEPFFINRESHHKILSSELEKNKIVNCFYNAIEDYTYNYV